jgi:hypothetical protein
VVGEVEDGMADGEVTGDVERGGFGGIAPLAAIAMLAA